MPRKRGRQRAPVLPNSDFSINEFANAEPLKVISGRISKSVMVIPNAKTVVHQLQVQTEAELEWFEKDISEFDNSVGDLPVIHEAGENDELTGNAIGGRKHRRKRLLSEEPSITDFGNVYPLDLWALLGSFIRVEDVSTFSRICHSSHLIVHSAKFWYDLYKRCYVLDLELPESLQLANMSRVHGLRTRVIRALYIMHPPMQQRLLSLSPFSQDPEQVVGARCMYMWYRKIKNTWHFYFKLRHAPSKRCPLSIPHSTDLCADPNLHANPEEDCTVLQIVTPNFLQFPVVMGQVLSKTFISVGHEMRFHKVKLIFHPMFSPNDRNILTNGTAVIIDPAINLHVLHWWDPKYPIRS